MSNTKLPDLNKVLIASNSVKYPEWRYTFASVPVVNFKIASPKELKDDLAIYREEAC